MLHVVQRPTMNHDVETSPLEYPTQTASIHLRICKHSTFIAHAPFSPNFHKTETGSPPTQESKRSLTTIFGQIKQEHTTEHFIKSNTRSRKPTTSQENNLRNTHFYIHQPKTKTKTPKSKICNQNFKQNPPTIHPKP